MTPWSSTTIGTGRRPSAPGGCCVPPELPMSGFSTAAGRPGSASEDPSRRERLSPSPAGSPFPRWTASPRSTLMRLLPKRNHPMPWSWTPGRQPATAATKNPWIPAPGTSPVPSLLRLPRTSHRRAPSGPLPNCVSASSYSAPDGTLSRCTAGPVSPPRIRSRRWPSRDTTPPSIQGRGRSGRAIHSAPSRPGPIRASRSERQPHGQGDNPEKWRHQLLERG